MRTLGTIAAELGLTVTRPGYLVSIGFGTPLYLSTIGNVTWGGHSWVAEDIKVEGLSRDINAARDASLNLGNLHGAYGTLCRSEGVGNRAVQIYTVYVGAPSDAVLEFDGVGDGAEVGPRVKISLINQATQKMFAPRRTIGPATGFNISIPAGSHITMGGEIYILERA